MYSKIINGQLALGYGSKYQLLRMLGWHRHDFTEKIKAATGIQGDVQWLDFEYSGPCDKELLNLDFIPEVKEEWRHDWMCGRGGINWDAVGIADDGTYVLVEAKAHIQEMKSAAGGNSRAKEHNSRRIAAFMDKHGIQAPIEAWTDEAYQLANRLVITDFLLSRNYKVKLVYVLFENGFEYNCSKADSASADEWMAEMRREFDLLGITGTRVEDMVNICIINCDSTKSKP